MAVERSGKPSTGSLGGPWLLVTYLIGFVAIYFGERLIGGFGTSRWILSGVGVALVLCACTAWLVAWSRTEGEKRSVERLVALLSLGGLLSLLVYLFNSDLILGPAPVVKMSKEGVGFRQVLSVIWPVILVCSLLPLIFVQWSLGSMAKDQGVEKRRAMGSARAGATTGMLLCTLFLLNAIINRKDVYADLSYFKTTSPSESTRELIIGLSEDTKVLLFYPKDNEVLNEIMPYFQDLSGLSPRLQLDFVDLALDPNKAKEYRINSQGKIVLARGAERQVIELDEELDRAKYKLSKLDLEFQKALLKLTREEKTVYLIAGHGERSQVRVEWDNRPLYIEFTKFLSSRNLRFVTLNAAGGLGVEVPDDAALLVWIDPSGPPFAGEIDAIKRYLIKGGRMLMLLDPDSDNTSLDEFLKFLGLNYHRKKLADERNYVPMTRTKADRYSIVTNNYTVHPAVSTVTYYRQYMPVLFHRTGYFKSVMDNFSADRTWRVNFPVRAMDSTWPDLDGNFMKGNNEEPDDYFLVATIDGNVEDIQSRKETGAKGFDKSQIVNNEITDDGKAYTDMMQKKLLKRSQMRVVVYADSDVFADTFIAFRGSPTGYPSNLQLLADNLKWLLGEGEVAGLPEIEEDVPIAHTREDDIFWFYATVFTVPLLIMGIGLGTRWGRGRKRVA